jgi:hypothetical protein
VLRGSTVYVGGPEFHIGLCAMSSESEGHSCLRRKIDANQVELVENGALQI